MSSKNNLTRVSALISTFLLLAPADGFGADAPLVPPATQPNTFVYTGTNLTGQYSLAPRPAGVPSSYERTFGSPPPASEVTSTGAGRYVFATNNFGSVAQQESAVWYAHQIAHGRTVYVVPGTGFVDPRTVGHFADSPGGGTVVNSGRVYPVEELTVDRAGNITGRRYIPDVDPRVVERQNALLDQARNQLNPPRPTTRPPTSSTPGTAGTGSLGTGGTRGLGTNPGSNFAPGRSPFTSPEGARAGQLVRDLRYTPPPSTAATVARVGSQALAVVAVAQALNSGITNTGNLMNAYLDPAGTRAALESGQLRVWDLIPFVGGNPGAELVIGIVEPIFNDFSRAEGILGTAGAVLMIPVHIVDGAIVRPITGLIDLGVQGLAHVFAGAGNAFCRLTGLCNPNLCVRGTQGCEGRGGSNGDPHMATFDGQLYDLQAVGELVLSSDGDGFTVQARQQPWGNSTYVSVNTALAMQVGTNRVTYDIQREVRFWIDGEPAPQVGTRYILSGGGRIDFSGGAFDITWPTGQRLHANIRSDHLDIGISPSQDQVGRLFGLLGNFDGTANNDFRTRAGALLPAPISFIDLYNTFAADWRVTAEESLFDYEPGQSTETWTDLNFPRAPIAAVDLDPVQRAAAEATCAAAGVVDENILEGCILDVAVTASTEFAEGAAEIPPPAEILVPSCPVPQDLAYYGSSNYQYLLTADPPEGWQSPSFDDSAWTAASGRLGNTAGCGAPGPNLWPADRGAIVRLRFDVDDACGLQLGFSLTGEIEEAYLNGQPILSNSFFHHRCAGTDDLVLNPPRSTWTTGENVLAVRLRSTLDLASYDHRVSIGAFTGPAVPTCEETDATCDGIDDDCSGTVDEDYLERDTSCGLGVCVASGRSSCVLGVELDSCRPLEPPPGDISCLGNNVTRISFDGRTRNGNDDENGMNDVDVQIVATGASASYGVLCETRSFSGGYYSCSTVLPDRLNAITVEHRSYHQDDAFATPVTATYPLTPGGDHQNYVSVDLTGYPTTVIVEGTVRATDGSPVPYAFVQISGDISGGTSANFQGNYRVGIAASELLSEVTFDVVARSNGLSSETVTRTTLLAPRDRTEVEADLYFAERRLRVLGFVSNENGSGPTDGLSGVQITLQKDGVTFCDRFTFPMTATYNYLCPPLVTGSGDAFEVTYTLSSIYGSRAGSFTVFPEDLPTGGQQADYRYDTTLAATTLWVYGIISDATGAGINGGTARIEVPGYGSRIATAGSNGYYELRLPIAEGEENIQVTIEGSDGANAQELTHPVSLTANQVTPLEQSFSFESTVDGTGRWGFAANTSGGDQVPAIGPDGTIYHSAERYLYAINPDGTQRWRYQFAQFFGGGTTSPVLGPNGVIYAGDNNGDVHAVNAATGVRVWRYHPTNRGFGNIFSVTLSPSGTIYVGRGGQLIALDSTGAELWAVTLEPESFDFAQNIALGQDGTLYVTCSYRLMAFNPDGSRRYVYETGNQNPPAIGADGNLYLMTGSSLTSLSPRGEVLWASEPLQYPTSYVAIGAEDRIYVAEGNRLRVFTSTGGVESTTALSEDRYFASTTPSIGDDGVVYLVSNSTHLIAVDPAAAALVFDFESPSGYLFEPVAGAEGTVYIIGNDRLYAINAPSAGLAESAWPKMQRNLENTGAADAVPVSTRYARFTGTVTHAELPGLSLHTFAVTVRDGSGRLCSAVSALDGSYSCTGPTTELGEHSVTLEVSGLNAVSAEVFATVPAGALGTTVEAATELFADATTLVVSGRVADDDGNGLAGAIVEALYTGDLEYRRATDAAGAPLPYSFDSGAPYTVADANGDYVFYLHYRQDVGDVELTLRASSGLSGSRTATRFVTVVPLEVTPVTVDFTLLNQDVAWSVDLFGDLEFADLNSATRPVLSNSGHVYVTVHAEQNFSEFNRRFNRLVAVTTDGSSATALDFEEERQPSEVVLGPDGTAYFTDRRLWAVAADMSGALWAYENELEYNLSRPAVGADGTVYFSAYEDGPTVAHAVVYDGDLGTGVDLWTEALPEGLLYAPAVGPDGDLYLGVDGALYALDTDPLASPRVRFSAAVGGSSYYGSFVPVASGETMICVVEDHAAAISTADGAAVFNETLASYATGSGEPAVRADGTIYYSSGNTVVALDAGGALLWSLELEDQIYGTIALGPDRDDVYVIAHGVLTAIDVDEGVPSIAWIFGVPNVEMLGSPAVDQDHIYVVGSDGILYAVTRTDLDPPPPIEPPGT